MKLLYKTVFGSNLYGTNTPKSDKDYKIVFLPDIKTLLLGEKKLSSIASNTSDHNTKNTKDDIDTEYIPLQVLVRDFAEGQTYALEVAFSMFSDVENEIYDNGMKDFFKEMIERFLTDKTQSMMGYALSQSIRYGVKGTKLKSLMTVYDVLCQYDDTRNIKEVFPALTMTKYVYMDGDDLIIHGKMYKNYISILEAKKRVQKAMEAYGSRSVAAMEHDSIDWKSVSHAVRISGMVIRLLQDGKLIFPLPEDEATLVKAIKNGEMQWKEVETIISERLSSVDDMVPNIKLKQNINKEDLDQFLSKYLVSQYKLNL